MRTSVYEIRIQYTFIPFHLDIFYINENSVIFLAILKYYRLLFCITSCLSQKSWTEISRLDARHGENWKRIEEKVSVKSNCE